MIRFLIASHGHLASGIKNSVEILFGNSDRIVAIDCYIDSSNPNTLIDRYFQEVDESDTVVMLSDLYGGSVNTLLYPYLQRKNTYLIAGYNLALVLELVGCTSDDIDRHRIDEIVNQSQTMMTNVEFDTNKCEESDFF